MSCLPKPILRGHIKRRGVRTIIGALLFGAFNATLYHVLSVIPRRQNYEEFMRTYNAKQHFKQLVQWHYIIPNDR